MIIPGSKVLISGDSWGCGEWEFDAKDKSTYISHTNGLTNYGVTHLGLEQYLIDYRCTVYNVSQGGASNIDSINRLKQALTEFKPDKVIWIQTDPIRDLRPYTKDNFPKSVKEMIELQKELLNKSYETLNSLGVKINCMGGTSKLQESINQHENLIPLVDSIIEYFDTPSVDIWISEWINYNKEVLCEQLVDELYELPKPNLPIEWFWPDGVHPNRHAHKKLFEHIFLIC